RVKGLKGVSKREGRATSDGLVAADVRADGAGEVGTLVEVNSETDFVAKNATFLSLAETVLATAATSGTDDVAAILASDVDGAPLTQVIDETAATLGEKLVLRRVGR